MSLFGLADINFNKQPGPQGPLRALEGSEFDTTTLRYPRDIGNYDKGHYMVFYVRQQKNTNYKRDVASESLINSNAVGAGKTFQDIPLIGNAGTNLGSELLGKLNNGLSSLNGATGGALSGLTGKLSSAAGGIVGGINNLFGQKASIPTGDAASTQKILSENIASITNNSFIKTTELTKDAIALYMPDTLQYTYTQSYDQLNIGSELAGQAMAAGRSIIDEAQRSGTFSEGTLTKAAAAGGEVLKQKGLDALGSLTGSQQTAQVGQVALFGRVQNPLLELVYKSPNFRQFQFDFVFYPRDEKEALEVQRIIERFRFHQAPEFLNELTGFLIPPSQFDIRFYYGGVQNPNIPKIATCVLTSIDVNYAPNGFSAYEVPGESSPALGRTGMPVAIQMGLQFQEVTYLTKKDFTSDSSFDSIPKR